MKIIANDYEAKFIMKTLREWTGLKQANFAESLNLSKSTIQSYEQGKRVFPFDTFMRIADMYGITVTLEKKNSK